MEYLNSKHFWISITFYVFITYLLFLFSLIGYAIYPFHHELAESLIYISYFFLATLTIMTLKELIYIPSPNTTFFAYHKKIIPIISKNRLLYFSYLLILFMNAIIFNAMFVFFLWSINLNIIDHLESLYIGSCLSIMYLFTFLISVGFCQGILNTHKPS